MARMSLKTSNLSK
jgi:hypothetical protein